ncbi:MAG: DNA translocase FtsK [Candidatus Sumerlaea chitinivorans]|nr:DNA translocase FtsK [Candidatus Sumerlaea chitinivorans]
MFNSQARRSERIFGLRPETLNDIVALTIFLVGLLLFLSLATQTSQGNLIGRLGELVYQVLSFVFGVYVAYVPVLLILGWGISFWSGRRWQHVPARVAGLFLTMVWVCAILALPYAEVDFSKENGFRVGGAIGNFLVHRECLNLKGTFGPVGCWILFLGGLIISLLVAADVQLRPMFVRLWGGLRQLRPSRLFAGRAERPSMFERVSASLGLEATGEEEPVERVELAPQGPAPTKTAAYTVPFGAAGGSVSDVSRDKEGALRLRPASIGAAEPLNRESVEDREQSTFACDDQKANQEDTAPDDLVALAQQQARVSEVHAYVPPPVDLFRKPDLRVARQSHDEIRRRSEVLERTLAEFDVRATVVNVEQGPTVTCFELELEPGTKISKLTGLEDNIAMAMRAQSVRIIAPIPGKGTVGLEIPNSHRSPVFLREILETEAFMTKTSPLAFALGKTITGEPYVCDLAQMPHLLIAGTTGSGKSVCLNAIICSILYRMEPDRVKFIMIDPKRVELNVYRDIPHLLAPVVCEPKQAANALAWAVKEMDSRYKKLEALGVRNIDGYNAIVCSDQPHPKAMGQQLEYMPHIVIVVDELSDLMLLARNEVEESIVRLAQMSRAVGMHLIVATQRPSVNVITGIIKANFPCRIAFQVSSKVDSRTILDCAGAEALLGKGDMLFSMAGAPKPIRIQACYVADDEVECFANYLRQQARPNYLQVDFSNSLDDETTGEREFEGDNLGESLAGGTTESMMGGGGASRPRDGRDEDDPDVIDELLVRDAARVILQARSASISLLQRRLRIGFARAGRIMDILHERGIVGPSLGSKPREILVDPEEYLAELEDESQMRF